MTLREAKDKALNLYAGWDLDDLFREYFNNFLSVEGFAEWHRIPVDKAERLIKIGKRLHERRVKNARSQYKTSHRN